MQNKEDFFPSLAALHYVCQHQQIPFVSYRLPLHSAITTQVQHLSQPVIIQNTEELNHSEGFVVAPFCTVNNQKIHLLQADFEFKDDTVSAEKISELSTCNLFVHLKNKKSDLITTSKQDFENYVNTAVEAMKKGDFRKVVLSKVQKIDLFDNFSAAQLFQKLCSKYPHAFVYFFQVPEVGCWIGATPEPLLTSDEKYMQTVSLAGTQPATSLPLEAYKWSEKELEEQEIVTNFVEEVLISAGIKHYTKSAVENYKAANLIHLKSGFKFEYDTAKSELSKLIDALHPTPSVGGLPRKEAIDFIQAHEKHNRSYYTGYLGLLNAKEGTNLYVNLRCMQLFSKSMVLYSGAGITASSVAANEWEETENKLMTLKQVIFHS